MSAAVGRQDRLEEWLAPFRILFTQPTWRRLLVLSAGAILTASTNGGRCVAGHGTRVGCGLLTLSRRSQPKPVVGTGGGQTASGAVGRGVRPRRPGSDRAGRHDRAALGREDRRPGHLPGSGALEPWPFRQGERPALAVGHAAGTGALGTASVRAAVPDRADAVAALGRPARCPPQVARRRCPEDAPLDVTPAFHPAATRDRPVLSRMSAGEATGGVNLARCCSSSAANAAGWRSRARSAAARYCSRRPSGRGSSGPDRS